jgi:hypothetical protein
MSTIKKAWVVSYTLTASIALLVVCLDLFMWRP